MIRWNLVGWFVAAIIFIVGFSVAVGQGELIARLQKVTAASADCEKWLDNAVRYAESAGRGWAISQITADSALSSAYSLLAIAHGCGR